MSIFGIGTDLVNIKRIDKNLIKHGTKFKQKIFTDKEVIYCDKKVNSSSSYAKRFAAKEAFLKALGTGLINGINFKNIEVVNNKLGKPDIKLSGKVAMFFNKIIKNKAYQIHLSLSDDKPWAQATVVICLE